MEVPVVPLFNPIMDSLLYLHIYFLIIPDKEQDHFKDRRRREGMVGFFCSGRVLSELAN